MTDHSQMDLALARHGSIWVSRQGTGEPTRLAWTPWTSHLAYQKSDTESSKCNVSFRRYACTNSAGEFREGVSTNNNVERFWQARQNLDLAEPATPLPPFPPSSLGKGHATATRLPRSTRHRGWAWIYDHEIVHGENKPASVETTEKIGQLNDHIGHANQ